MRAIFPLALATVLVAGCASVPPDQDPTQIRLNDLDARVSKVERVISNQSLVRLAEQSDSLQAQIRDLRGQVEDLQNANQALRKQQHDFYADLDRRVTALEHGSSPAASSAGSGGEAGEPGVTSTQQSVYGQAFDALKAGSYSVAISGFQDFLNQYPASPLAPNAEYWLGEAHYVNHDFAAAESAFQAVLDKWPSSSKAPDAMLDLGNTQLAQGKNAKGRATLRRVMSQYAGTDAANRAQTRLKQLSSR
ncbi:MAG TPA: tol-pal system protein YbgF [Steroidobacteraceae bacterium]|nr:tol-pal system protein YbgF [Steroidobacteraceae bacterium]